ncbi:retrovirus-related pol polyprotein from transposon TNT 1-94 [Tanacetum coccineum]
MSQDVLLTVMNSMSLNGESMNVEMQRNESCDNCFNLDDKVFVITSLKNDLRKLKGKEIVNSAAQISYATTIVSGMFKLDLDPLAPKLLQNREAYIDYLNHIQEQADIVRLLVYVRDMYPNVIKLSAKKVDVTPLNNVKKVRLKCSPSNYVSKPTGNKKNDMISQTPSRNMKNKAEARPKKVNKKNRIVEPICDTDVKHSLLNANSKLIFATCCPDYSLLDSRTSKLQRLWGMVIISREMLLSQEYTTSRGLDITCFLLDNLATRILKLHFGKTLAFIRNLEGVDLLSGSRDTNLYTISLDNMLKTSLICLLSKASKTKSWLWHHRLSHLNFEAARTMLIFSKVPLFLCAEAIYTTCYTQNHSLICLRYNKIPYELIQDKKSDLSFLHVFGSLCYPTNNNEDLSKLDAEADIGIFIGYAPAKKVFKIYNRRTRKIIETIHVTFDELTTMASEQFSSGPGLHSLTHATSSLGIVSNPVSQQTFQEAAVPRVVVLPDTPVWTKDHPIVNVIGDLSHSVFTRKKLQIDVMWCYFDAFLTYVEPKNFNQAMAKPSWIDKIQEEIHEFERLEVWELVPCPDKVFLIKLK